MKFEEPKSIERRESKSEPLKVMKINVASEPSTLSRAISQVMDIFGGDPSPDSKHPGIKFDKKSPFFRGLDKDDATDDESEFTRIDQVYEALEKLRENNPKSLPDVLAIVCDQETHNMAGTLRKVRSFIHRLRNDFPEEKMDDYYPYVLVIAPHFLRIKPDDIPEADFVLADMTQFVTLLASQLVTIPDLLDHVMPRYEEAMIEYKGKFYDEYKEKIKERSGITADTEQEVQKLEDIFEENGVETVLDAGGGEGRIAQPLAFDGYSVTGVDLSPELVKKAQEKKLNFVIGDLRALKIDDNSQDAVMFNWHVFCDILGQPAKLKVLSEANRVLKEAGIVVLDIPNRDKLSIKKDGIYFDDPGGKYIYVGYVPKAEEMKAFLQKSGFAGIEIKEWETKQGYPKLTFVAKKK